MYQTARRNQINLEDSVPRTTYPQQHTLTTPNSSVWVGELPGVDPAIVLLHGFPDDSTIYDRLVPFLGERRVLAIDFAGYGLSSRDAFVWADDQRESEIVSVLEQLDVVGATLVGHDASLPVAINIALDHTDRVGKLVLLNGYFNSDGNLKLPDMIRLFGTVELNSLSDAIMGDPQQLQWLLGYSGAQFGIDASDPAGVATNSIIPAFFGSPGEHADSRTAIREWTARLYPGIDDNNGRVAAGDLGKLDIPVIVAFGEGDPFLTPEVAARIGALFTDVQVEGVRESSHWPQWDQPEVVARAIL